MMAVIHVAEEQIFRTPMSLTWERKFVSEHQGWIVLEQCQQLMGCAYEGKVALIDLSLQRSALHMQSSFSSPFNISYFLHPSEWYCWPHVRTILIAPLTSTIYDEFKYIVIIL